MSFGVYVDTLENKDTSSLKKLPTVTLQQRIYRPKDIARCYLRIRVHNSKNSQTQNLRHCYTVNIVFFVAVGFSVLQCNTKIRLEPNFSVYTVILNKQICTK